jgi:hypothetical protein
MIASLLGAAGALGARVPPVPPVQDLSPETVREMLRTLGGVEPMPSEEAYVRAFLLSYRLAARPDPEVEPALTFDPDVDVDVGK